MFERLASTKPNGKVRVFINLQHFNSALKHRYYPLPVVEEILPQLAKIKAFTKADLKDGYYISITRGQVPLTSHDL